MPKPDKVLKFGIQKKLKKKLKLAVKAKAVQLEKAVPVVRVVSEQPAIYKPELPVVELIPWTFKRPDKVTIKRENWNNFVKKIQAAAISEAEHENEDLHKQIQVLLNERDNLVVKYAEMEKFTSKFAREFQATYGV